MLLNINKGSGKILANIGWMTFDKIFILFLNLFVTVRIANNYGTTGYGTYQYAVSIVAILEVLIKLADGRIVKKQYIDNDPFTVVLTATVTRLLFSFISALVGILYIIFCKKNDEFSFVFFILLINAIVVNLRFGMTNHFEYSLKSKKVVIATDFSLIIGSILQLIAVYVKWSIVSIAIIALITSAVNFFVVCVQYKREFRNSKRKLIVDKKMLSRIIKESIPFAIAASCSTIYARCDSVMIGKMLSIEDVGVYAIAVKLISIVQIAIHPVCESVYPRLMKLYNTSFEEYKKIYIRITSCLTWIFIAGATVSIIVLPWIFKMLKPDYLGAYSVYKIYLIGIFFVYNAALSTGHFALIDRGIILTYIQIISMISNVILNFLLISRFGLYGAAAATAITHCISTTIAYAFFKKDGRQVFKWQVQAINPLRMLPNRKVK